MTSAEEKRIQECITKGNSKLKYKCLYQIEKMEGKKTSNSNGTFVTFKNIDERVMKNLLRIIDGKDPIDLSVKSERTESESDYESGSGYGSEHDSYSDESYSDESYSDESEPESEPKRPKNKT